MSGNKDLNINFRATEETLKTMKILAKRRGITYGEMLRQLIQREWEEYLAGPENQSSEASS